MIRFMGIGKIELHEALIVAQQIENHVRSAMDRVEIAGSIRRKKPIVGDIEIVGIPADRSRLVQLLSEIGQHIKPSVPGVIPWIPKENSRYLRLRLSQGINLDFFCATQINWGGLFLMRTGSASGSGGNTFNGFVPGMFSRFKKLSGGGRMTDCMPTMPSGEQLWVPEEQDFFDLLEMDFVPPEERVDRKVIKKYALS